ncbi:LysR family transcriptional regulator [Paraburkholderia sp.]|uniref:LysR family transcriptional regulator n=1 Tax=Paraburkholderia sp. TaxID=1926495 RepID=UPI00286F6C03|nr:LysR family transcriptional regulator [Paraburkholderia sp.]
MDINGCLAFAAVVESGSFAAAARELGVPRSTVSARVAALETRLGVRLLRRSTRSLALTAEGETWYATVGGAIATLREAERRGLPDAGVLSGTIRVSVPLDFPDALLADASPSVLAAHERGRIDVHVSNAVVDFVNGQFDLAIRGGAPGSNEAVARRIAGFTIRRYASPAYLAAHANTDTLAFVTQLPGAGHDAGLRVEAGQGVAAQTARQSSRVQANSFALLKELALRGAGVAALPAHLCEREIAQGTLIEVTTDGNSAEETGLFIVYPSRRDMSARVRAFAHHLASTLEAQPTA